MRKEELLQIALVDYLRIAYPKVYAISEQSGLRVSPGLASKLKRMRTAQVHLDLYVLQPVKTKDGKHYCGLILELKAREIYKKDGTLFKDDHLHDQQKTINQLNEIGYKACFVTSLNDGIKIIDDYLNGNLKG